MEQLFLVYIKPVCRDDTNKVYEYDFLFSETPEIVWGRDWDEMNPTIAISGDLTPDPSTFSVVKRVKTSLPLKTVEETTCYSMEYTLNGSIALAWIDIEKLEDYPENGRMVFHFQDTYEKTEELLGLYDYTLE